MKSLAFLEKVEHERSCDLFVNNPNSRNVLIDVGFTKALLEMDHPTNISSNRHQDVSGVGFASSQDLMRFA